MQSKAYAELVEDRIIALEKKVRDIMNIPEAEREGPNSSSTIPINKLCVKELDWPTFGAKVETGKAKLQAWMHRPEINPKPQHIIEVLVEEPSYIYGPGLKIEDLQSHQPAQAGEKLVASPTLTEPSRVTVQNDNLAMPFRVRIRSPLLMKLINEVTRLNTVVGPHKHKIVLYRPFKLLVACADDLRKHLKRLEAAATGKHA